MLTTIECAGHPRDMGLAQGAAARASIRAEALRLGLSTSRSRMPSLRALAVGSVRGTGAGREMLRHFAHLSERLDGLARAAGVPFDTILEMHLRVRAGGAQAGLLARRATLRAHTAHLAAAASGGNGTAASAGKRLLVERSLPCRLDGEANWILRESRPAVGFRSVEVTLPWLVSAVAGVNEGGLAVVGGPLLWGASGRDGSPTSLLLVQECLQRFEDLDGALGWCLKRPVLGEQTLVLADASGEVATLVVDGRERRVQPGEGELHLEAGELPEASEASEKTESAPLGAGNSDRFEVDPSGRSVRLRLDGSELYLSLG